MAAGGEEDPKSDIRRILFVTEKWVDCDPALPLSSAFDTYFGSLAATSLAQFENFFVDETVLEQNQPCDQALFEKCDSYRPDLVFIAMQPKPEFTPKRQTLTNLRERLNIKVATIFGDTFSDNGVEWMEYFADHVDLILVLDSYHNYQNLVADPDKYLPIWLPLDPNIYFNTAEDRPIDVSFLGSTESYPDRILALGVLISQGIDLQTKGGQREAYLPPLAYAGLLRQSKLTLNFSRTRFGYPAFQCKGRVMEATMCGCLLLEEKNDETPLWLTPGEDYVAFENEADLADKVRYYLEHDDERLRIAGAGQQKASSRFGPAQFWRRVFDNI